MRRVGVSRRGRSTSPGRPGGRGGRARSRGTRGRRDGRSPRSRPRSTEPPHVHVVVGGVQPRGLPIEVHDRWSGARVGGVHDAVGRSPARPSRSGTSPAAGRPAGPARGSGWAVRSSTASRSRKTLPPAAYRLIHSTRTPVELGARRHDRVGHRAGRDLEQHVVDGGAARGASRRSRSPRCRRRPHRSRSPAAPANRGRRAARRAGGRACPTVTNTEVAARRRRSAAGGRAGFGARSARGRQPLPQPGRALGLGGDRGADRRPRSRPRAPGPGPG